MGKLANRIDAMLNLDAELRDYENNHFQYIPETLRNQLLFENRSNLTIIGSQWHQQLSYCSKSLLEKIANGDWQMQERVHTYEKRLAGALEEYHFGYRLSLLSSSLISYRMDEEGNFYAFKKDPEDENVKKEFPVTYKDAKNLKQGLELRLK